MFLASQNIAMCGIQCCAGLRSHESLQNSCQKGDWVECSTYNEHRGPDSTSVSSLSSDINDKWRAHFKGYVLWTQGKNMADQPLCLEQGHVLLWNGDIFSGPLAPAECSDTEALYNALSSSDDILKTMVSVRGPYSFIYFQKQEQKLYFGRDPIGRHSLLIKVQPEAKEIIISSVASKNASNFIEVPAIGVFVVDMKKSDLNLTFHPWRHHQGHREVVQGLEQKLKLAIDVDFAIFASKSVKVTWEPEKEDLAYLDLVSGVKNPHDTMQRLLQEPEIAEHVNHILKLLKESVRMRIHKKPNFCKMCLERRHSIVKCEHPKVGLLFSGGLDSTILAAVACELIDEGEVIDLINVAFERAQKEKANGNSQKKGKRKSNNGLQEVLQEAENLINYDVPDRKTGRLAFAELKRIFPERKWNFIECNVTQKELAKYRSERICHVIYPLRTILDESVGCALWFAARGIGTISAEGDELYESPCRFLLLGMGADELFGGYIRHRNALKRKGWIGLAEELDKEIARIGERNLGRDDRVVSDHGKQSRLPYLDENFVDYVTSLQVWQRCCPLESMPPGLGDKLLLRLCAYKLGLKETATFPKRAFQFGSRIAKSHENAADESQWLQ